MKSISRLANLSCSTDTPRKRVSRVGTGAVLVPMKFCLFPAHPVLLLPSVRNDPNT